MRRAARWTGSGLWSVAVLVAALGCDGRPLSAPGGGEDGSASGASGAFGGVGASGASGFAGGAAGAGGIAAHDTCESDADCPAGACAVVPCPRVICARGDDGFRHCTSPSPPTPRPCAADDPSCCASDSECSSGDVCAASVPGFTVGCGGVPPFGNFCVGDQCHSDVDCGAEPNGACSATSPRKCAYGACRTNADCTASPGGACVVALVDLVAGCYFAEVFCRYDGDPCRTDADCPAAQACVPGTGVSGTSCTDRTSPPP